VVCQRFSRTTPKTAAAVFTAVFLKLDAFLVSFQTIAAFKLVLSG